MAPCGDWTKKQCPDGCEEGIQTVTEADEEQLQESFKKRRLTGFRFRIWENVQSAGKSWYSTMSMPADTMKKDI